jgi:hypothetical protein
MDAEDGLHMELSGFFLSGTELLKRRNKYHIFFTITCPLEFQVGGRLGLQIRT